MNLRRYITYPHVVSSLALFIALGGSAYAVTQIDPNSVGTKQLKADAVKSGKIKNKTIKRVDTKDGAFATPPQLAGKLGIAATAANSAKLGNIGPNGFVQGLGTTIATDYDITATNGVATIPGGGSVNVRCNANGHQIRFFAPPGNNYDLYTFSWIEGTGTPSTGHRTATSSDLFVLNPTKESSVFQFDATSASGGASLTVWSRFNDTTDHCIGRVRGVLLPEVAPG